MIDTVYHQMKRAPKAPHWQTVGESTSDVGGAKSNPAIGALLDHVGRLLAKEYVALLRSHDTTTKGRKR